MGKIGAVWRASDETGDSGIAQCVNAIVNRSTREDGLHYVIEQGEHRIRLRFEDADEEMEVKAVGLIESDSEQGLEFDVG